jgi:hypothetical protein
MTVIKNFLIQIYVLEMHSYFFLRNIGDDLSNIKILFCTRRYIYFCSNACLQKVNKVDREGAIYILGVRRRS